ncbi:MAG: hypothetical protein IPL21_07765 [Saprospirales bacterium]|nr:hypothetical protein [Saprospirales bacterium]
MSWNNGNAINDTFWKAENVSEKHYGSTSEDYTTDVLSKKAISFIKDAERMMINHSLFI